MEYVCSGVIHGHQPGCTAAPSFAVLFRNASCSLACPAGRNRYTYILLVLLLTVVLSVIVHRLYVDLVLFSFQL